VRSGESSIQIVGKQLHKERRVIIIWFFIYSCEGVQGWDWDIVVVVVVVVAEGRLDTVVGAAAGFRCVET
jgi:hypothetical protein